MKADTATDLAAIWQAFVAIAAPTPKPPARVSQHTWTPSKYWRQGVETSPGNEAYPGCKVCGLTREKHTLS